MFINDIYITDSLQECLMAQKARVKWIMIDLEVIDKQQRQATRNTRLSTHSKNNIPQLLSSLNSSELIVRTDQPKYISRSYLKDFILMGVYNFMIPYWQSLEQLNAIVRTLDSLHHEYGGTRPNIIPLIETKASLSSIVEAKQLPFPFFHFGLNDLSLQLDIKNMFDILYMPYFRSACQRLSRDNISFGIGGLGLVSKVYLNSVVDLIEAHHELGSNGYIYTRDFNALASSSTSKCFDQICKLRHSFQL